MPDTRIDEALAEALAAILDHPLLRVAGVVIQLFLVTLWLASAWWVMRDLRERQPGLAPPYLAAGAIIVSTPLLFVPALLIYRIVRPAETLGEAYERRLVTAARELESAADRCPGCRRLVDDRWLACPSCRTRLAHRCVSCGRSMELDWLACAWCGTEFGHAVAPDRGTVFAPARREAADGVAAVAASRS